MSRAPLYAVIPAGGAGTRLWPLSRQARPKFLLDLDGSGRSLLQGTWDRLSRIVDPAHIVVVTGEEHAAAVREQLPCLSAENLLAEPSPRDSMPAIGWAAATIARRDPEAVIGSFAADHLIDDETVFAAAVATARSVAETGLICTIGIRPTGPATGFGYIERSDRLDPQAGSAYAVARFIEKPDAAKAAEYLATGRFLWNAGMFLSRASVLLARLRAAHPDLADGLERIAADHRTLPAVWPTLTTISIDHAVAEPAASRGALAMVEGRFGWNDVGDFAAVAALGPGLGTAEVAAVDAAEPFVASSTGTPVTVVGLDDAVVVDAGDAILVTTRAHAQQVKQAVPAWRGRGRDDLL